MNSQPASPTPPPAPHRPVTIRRLLAMVLVLGLTLVTILYLILTARSDKREVILGERRLSTQPVDATSINTGQIIDMTAAPNAALREGYRYKVRIDDISRQGTAGIAYIAGVPVFVSGVQPGDIAIIQVSSVRDTSASAELISRVATTATASETQSAPPASSDEIIDLTSSTNTPPVMGAVYRGTVTDTGSKGDGIVRVGGKVVFIPNAKEGETVEFRITDQNVNFDIGELISSVPAASDPLDGSDDVLVGTEYLVTVTEKDRRNPENNGVTRINGLVVFIPGTQPGNTVRIRITERAPRFARAVVLERLP